MTLRRMALVYEAKEMVGALLRDMSKEDVGRVIAAIIAKLEIIRRKIEDDRKKEEVK